MFIVAENTGCVNIVQWDLDLRAKDDCLGPKPTPSRMLYVIPNVISSTNALQIQQLKLQ